MAFLDSDWHSDLDDQKSTTKYCVYFGNNLVSWSSRKQRVVSRSSTEVEYQGLATVTTEIVWVKSLLSELQVNIAALTIYYDNLGAVMLAANLIMHSQTKHFELDLYFVRDKVLIGAIQVFHLPSQFQVADILTKSITGPPFESFRRKLMVTSSCDISLRGDVKDSKVS
uniref:Copia protein n=1 Tax=Cajanus cajan TaxID=3821 RepID=A0A151UAI0_CAJCA|nr:Copia protein [Cajanus cajan]